MLRDLRSQTESPTPSMKSEEKGIVGTFQRPTHSISAQYIGDQHSVGYYVERTIRTLPSERQNR